MTAVAGVPPADAGNEGFGIPIRHWMASAFPVAALRTLLRRAFMLAVARACAPAVQRRLQIAIMGNMLYNIQSLPSPCGERCLYL